MNEPIKERTEERIERLTKLAQRIWPDKPDVRVSIYEGSDNQEAFVECKPIDGDASPLLFCSPYHPRGVDVFEVALLLLASDAPSWAEQLADAWEAHAKSLDPIHKDRASTYQDCADELRERAKGEP